MNATSEPLLKFFSRLIRFFTNEETGPIRCAFAVLAAGAVLIPATLLALSVLWS